MNNKPSIRVEGALQNALVIDDHPLFCDALSMTLKVGLGIEAVQTAGTLEDALAALDAGENRM